MALPKMAEMAKMSIMALIVMAIGNFSMAIGVSNIKT